MSRTGARKDGSRLGDVRRAAGITAAALATEVGCSAQTVRMAEAGVASAAMLERLAAGLCHLVMRAIAPTTEQPAEPER